MLIFLVNSIEPTQGEGQNYNMGLNLDFWEIAGLRNRERGSLSMGAFFESSCFFVGPAWTLIKALSVNYLTT
jgi:hypothetical protein